MVHSFCMLKLRKKKCALLSVKFELWTVTLHEICEHFLSISLNARENRRIKCGIEISTLRVWFLSWCWINGQSKTTNNQISNIWTLSAYLQLPLSFSSLCCWYCGLLLLLPPLFPSLKCFNVNKSNCKFSESVFRWDFPFNSKLYLVWEKSLNNRFDSD